MAGYQPVKVTGMTTGLVQEREEFILPNDAYPFLENAFVWRERLKRKKGYELLGRLRRDVNPGGGFVTLNQTTTAGTQTIILDVLNDANINVRTTQPNAEIVPGSVTINVGAGTATWNDFTSFGTLTPTGGIAAPGTINYATGQIVLNFTGPIGGGTAIQIRAMYSPAFLSWD